MPDDDEVQKALEESLKDLVEGDDVDPAKVEEISKKAQERLDELKRRKN
jgi:hypothetical protein